MMKDNANQHDDIKPRSSDYKREASWPSVLFFIHLNILGLYGIVVLFTQTRIITILFCEYLKQLKIFKSVCSILFKIFNSFLIAFVLTLMGIYGSTIGSHRLWTHKTFKSSTVLRFILMISQTMAGQVKFFFSSIFDIAHLLVAVISCVYLNFFRCYLLGFNL